MAQFLALIYEAEDPWANAGPATVEEIMSEHTAFSDKHRDAVTGGNALQLAKEARTIRADGAGGHTVTDGPFLETKEVLGGYYVIEADDLGAAVEIAKDVPARFGCVEVRPVMTFD